MVVGMTDKACEPSWKIELPPSLPLRLKCLSFEVFVLCRSLLDNICVAHELVPLDRRGACQQINLLGS